MSDESKFTAIQVWHALVTANFMPDSSTKTVSTWRYGKHPDLIVQLPNHSLIDTRKMLKGKPGWPANQLYKEDNLLRYVGIRVAQALKCTAKYREHIHPIDIKNPVRELFAIHRRVESKMDLKEDGSLNN
jgi:hypothetical protein